MSRITIAISAFLLCTACAGRPQPSSVYASDLLPEDWTKIEVEDWRYKAIDPTSRAALNKVKVDMIAQMSSTAFLAHGTFSEELTARIAEVQDQCNVSLQVSFAVVSREPTPELSGVAETQNDRTRGQAMVLDVNMRSIQDEWEGAWLMDRPATSAFPLVNTAGQP